MEIISKCCELSFGLCLLWSLWIGQHHCFPTNSSLVLSVPVDKLDGQKLVEIGDTLNHTLLTMMGSALVNLENDFNVKLCEINPCSEWTKWSNCSAGLIGNVGAQMRMRKCWHGNTKPCSNDGQHISENESKLCKGTVMCPKSYNLTVNGFCIKFDIKTVTQDEAEKACQQDGGHLINLDSAEIWTDFKNILNLTTHSGYAWVDGKRPGANQAWEYASGVDPASTGSENWETGQPGSPSTQFCQGVDAQFERHDRSCTGLYPYVCEKGR